MGEMAAMTSQIIFGTLLPFFNDPNGLDLASSNKGVLTLTGVAVSIIGFVILGRASWLRDHPKHSKEIVTVDDSWIEEAKLAKNGINEGVSNPKVLTDQEVPISVQEAGWEAVAPIKEKEPTGSSRALGVGIMVSLFAGIFSSLLQYAFVFGSDVVHYVEDNKGVSPMASSIIIWTVATAVNNMVQAVGLIAMITWRGLWGRYLEVSGR